MTRLLKPSLFLNRLVIKKQQDIVYDEKFHNGVNIIRGDNSSGKSTIMELIFFALGGVIPKKQWKEKASLCSEIYAEVQINERIFTLQRNITNNPQENMRIFEGKYEEEVILKWLKKFYWRFFSQQFKRSCLPDGPKVGSVAVSPRGDLRMPSDACVRIWIEELETL